MLRQPYNSEAPTAAQIDPSHPDHAQLAVKYACAVSPSDVGYAQTLIDAVDRLALAVGKDMLTAGLKGVMLFSIIQPGSVPLFIC
jgi:hypothetical protein